MIEKKMTVVIVRCLKESLPGDFETSWNAQKCITTAVRDGVSLGIEGCRTSSINFTLLLQLKVEKININ